MAAAVRAGIIAGKGWGWGSARAGEARGCPATGARRARFAFDAAAVRTPPTRRAGLTTPHGPNTIAAPGARRASDGYLFRLMRGAILADLTNAEVRALANASGITIPDDLLDEVRESLNGLLEALDAVAEPDVAGVEALPIIVSATARRMEV